MQPSPEFDVEKKYIFSIDSANRYFYIQDFAIEPKTKQAHFYQIIYEIPLDDLGAASFQVSKNQANNYVNLNIGTTNNKTSIVQYFLHDNAVVAILVQDYVSPGKWKPDDQMLKDLNDIAQLYVENIPDKIKSTSFDRIIVSKHKYSSERVKAIGLRDTTKELNNGYCYAENLKNPPCYAGKNNSEVSKRKLLDALKTELKNVCENSFIDSPAVLNIDAEGIIESVYFLNLTLDQNQKINLSHFEPFSPGNDGSVNQKSKMLLVVN